MRYFWSTLVSITLILMILSTHPLVSVFGDGVIPVH
jgi:hypothetical protein